MVGLLGVGGMIWSYYHYTNATKIDTLKMNAALEMEINQKEVLQNILDFLARQDVESEKHYNDNINDFDRFLAQYESLPLTNDEKVYLTSLKKKYNRFKASSSDLFSIEKKQIKSIDAVKTLLNEKIERVLDDEWQLKLNASGAQSTEKATALMEIEINLHELVSAMRGYVIDRDPYLKKRVGDSLDDTKQWVSKLKNIELTDTEKIWFGQIQTFLDRVEDESKNVLLLEDRKYQQVMSMELMSTQMDELLDDKIQLAVANHLVSTQARVEVLIFCLLILIVMIVVLGGFFVWSYARKQLLVPINKLKLYADDVAKGKTDIEVDVHSKDELGELGSSFNALVENAQSLTKVADSLGRGDFSVKVEPRSADDLLGISLLEMRDNLRTLDSDNKKQVQIKSDVNNIIQSLQGVRSLDDLLQAVIKQLANALGAGVGAFYLKDTGDNLAECILRLMGTYAYTDRKSLSGNFKLGEGIVGQCAKEKSEIIITDIPDSYIQISSGCGNDAPRCIIAIPVLHESELLGVMEFATFTLFDDAQREIVSQVSRSLGIIINNVYGHQKTEDLLAQSQSLTEELQTQQEELRTSNEELEEKTRTLKENEEELKVQSEELQAANEELEEKTERLKAQNDDILKKNAEVEDAKMEVEQRAKDLALASKYKSEFLANMSHELRTPLNSLLILSKDLEHNKSGNLTDKQIESARIIHEGGQDLLTLINDILDLSKVEAGKLQVDIASVNVAAFFQMLQQQFEPIVKEKGLTFNVDIEGNMPETIDTDEQRLSQVLKNLCFNAVKFTEKGGITIKASLVSEGQVCLSVIDTGIGITPEKQKQIFEAFQQGDGSTNRNYGGTGLGLAISRAMAELLGGEITLTSEKGKGSAFALTIPVLQDANQVFDEKEEEMIHAAPVNETIPTKPPMPESINVNDIKVRSFIDDDRERITESTKSLLIIEDDAAFAKILMDIAHEKEYQCLSAGDGHSGIALAKQYNPSAIVLDVGLPDVDGLQVLEQLKFDLTTRHIPVHIVSAKEESPEYKQKGAVGYLLKPADADQLPDVFVKIESVNDTKIKKVLVVEDDDKSQLAIHRLIENDAVTIDSASTGKEAEDMIINNNYDCVILDLCLPDISGFELLKQLKKSKVDAPPVVVYTGRELEEEEHNELRLYASSIVLKGAESPERLLDEISLFLHSVESDLPDNQKHVIQMLHDSEKLLSHRRILLVDDDVRNVFALSSALEGFGLDVIVASNGKVALDKLENEGDIELVIMDIMMPIMDGYEAMEKIRADTHFMDTPIIALTAKAMAGDRAKCIDAGANDYITKPVDVDKLVSMMKVWLFR